MAEFHVLPLHHDSFLSDTSHLGALETGAYAALLMASWRMDDGGLPDDDVMLARMARCTTREWKRIRPLVMAFWTVCRDGKLRQKRLEIEREAARAKSKSASRAAKAKWLETNKRNNADASPTHMREPCGSDALTVTVIVNEEEVNTSSPEPREDELDVWPAEHDGAAVLSRQPSDNRGFGARTAGDVLAKFTVQTAPVEKRLKRQDRADQDMVRHLTSHGGLDTGRAWALVMAARDEDDPGHTDAARQVEKISREHKLGWFSGDDA